MEKLAKIEKPAPLSTIAYNALRESILSFHLEQGTIYNEVAVSQNLGLSRTPVREALLKLAAQGMVTFLPRKGFIVTSYTLEDVEEIFELRGMIETSVARKVARSITPASLDTLISYISIQKKAAREKDHYQFMISDREFHNYFFKLANNSRLLTITDNFQDMCHLMGTNVLRDETNYKKTIHEHEQIVSALKAHDPENAEKTVKRHLSMVKEIVKMTLKE